MSISSPSPFFKSTNETSSTPNSHPYAIKSSSSAILSRNNSVPSPVDRHHYVPLPRVEPIRDAHKKRRYIPSKKLSKAEATDEALTPGEDSVLIPTPPISVRVKRRDTLPNLPQPNKAGSEDILKELPTNPKQWTPFQLATYLSSVLRLRGGATVPTPVMRDVTAFIVRQRLNGRTFLKMTRNDYDAFNINPLWKEALMNANLTLRQSLLQGQVFGSMRASALSAEDLSCLRDSEEDNDPAASSTIPGAYVPWDRKRTLGRLQAGRVKGIAHKYDRSYSEGETGVVPTQGQSESDSDSSYMSSPVSARSDILPLSKEPEMTGSPLLPGNGTISYQEEPTMEELIQVQDQSSTLWGAKAWEDEELNITAKKITQEDGSAEEILNEISDRERPPRSETLVSLFSVPVVEMDIETESTEDAVVPITEGNKHLQVSEDIPAPAVSTSPHLDSFNSKDILPSGMQSDPSLSPSSGYLTNSSNPNDTSPTSLRSSIVMATDQATKPPEADASAMAQSAGSTESLHAALRILQDRLAVVEKRLIELESLETEKEDETPGCEGLPPGDFIKPDTVSVDRPTTSVIPVTSSLSASQSCPRTDIDDEDDVKVSNNYAQSDLSIYSYIFYASIGLAVMVLDKTLFGRKRA